jgi:hypothetical protein
LLWQYASGLLFKVALHPTNHLALKPVVTGRSILKVWPVWRRAEIAGASWRDRPHRL